MFRKKVLKLVNNYDTNTITEDMDLTLKILDNHGKNFKILFGAKVLVYTEAVLYFQDLINQRYRWRFGKIQNFYKYRQLFLNTNKKHNRLLTIIYLPFSLYYDLALFLEPIFIIFILYMLWKYQNPYIIIFGFFSAISLIIINLVKDNSLTNKAKIQMILLSPAMYIFFNFISIIEYISLIKMLFNINKIQPSLINTSSTWQHVERPKST